MFHKKLGFGLMRLPLLEAGNTRKIDLDTMKHMVDRFIGHGFTYFDTAHPYHGGNSETAFREVVAKRYPRTAYTITDKLTMSMVSSEEDVPAFFHAQLQSLGVDYVDCYLLHNMNHGNYQRAEALKAFDFLRREKAAGRMRHIGMSFHSDAGLLDKILTAHPEIEYVQLQLNYLDWEDPTVQSRKCYETATRFEKPVIVMEPLKGGTLARVSDTVQELFQNQAPDVSPASWALRFAASHPNVAMVLSGMSDESQMADNIKTMSSFEPLTTQELITIKAAVEYIKSRFAIPCTACRYCVDDCPKGIAIPEYFSGYNSVKQFGESQLQGVRLYYQNLARVRGKASECVKCGKCEEHCPQQIPIRSFLKEIAAMMEKK